MTENFIGATTVRKLIEEKETRLIFAGMIVIASNAGGAWSPIGDVTTTMLWIGGQITASNIIIKLILPSLVCLIVPLTILSYRIKGNVTKPEVVQSAKLQSFSERQQLIVFFAGVLVLIMVPVFKTITHLPPYMGMLIGLGILWIITEIMHSGKPERERSHLSVSHAVRKIDSPSILFFLGILLSIAALQSTGVLSSVAEWMTGKIGNENFIVISFGLLSSIIDNVPLVAASQGMYSLERYPTDHYFWEFLAYTTGTGGSALIIGSAAGIAAMGMEKISFMWYLRKISLLALIGYFAGAGIYMLQHLVF